METATEARFLIILISLLTLVSCLSWCLMSWVVRICPLASRHFALANLLILAGTLLFNSRTEQPSFWFWFSSDALVLTGFFLLYSGLITLFKLNWSTTSAQISLILGLLALLLLDQGLQSAWLGGLVFSATASSLLAHTALANFRAIDKEFSTSPALFASSPFILLALFFMFRFALILQNPQDISGYLSLKHADSLPQLWFFVFLTIVINSCLVGNAFARLVSKIRTLADRDSLTGLWNRRVIQQQLTIHARTSQRHQSIFSVLLIDLDFFKTINDNYGHQTGDEALIHASQCFKQVLREIDWLSRYGGEEFLILLPETNLHHASLVAERIREALVTNPFKGAMDLPLTASIGVASYHAGDTIDQLIASADKALYLAKTQGRNQMCTEDDLPTTENSHQTNAAV